MKLGEKLTVDVCDGCGALLCPHCGEHLEPSGRVPLLFMCWCGYSGVLDSTTEPGRTLLDVWRSDDL